MAGTNLTSPVYIDNWEVKPFNFIGSLGKEIYFDPHYGDTGGDGTAGNPLAGVQAAYALARDGRGDTIVYVNDGVGTSTSGGSNILDLDAAATAFTWAKNNTHLVGDCAATWVGQRCRVVNPASAYTTQMINFTGNSCHIENIEFYDGTDLAAAVCFNLTGDRNEFVSCHFAGGAHATAYASANSRSVKMTGAHENKFLGCTFGLDTVDHTAANIDLAFATNCARNMFKDCQWITKIDAGGTGAGHVFLSCPASSLDRETIFRSCLFINSTTYSGGAIMTNAFTTSATMGGALILDAGTHIIGCTDVASVDAGVYTPSLVSGGATTSGQMNVITR